MASLIGLVTGSGIIFLSRYYDGKLAYYKSAKKFEIDVNGVSYFYLNSSMVNPIEFQGVNLLSKETIVKKRITETILTSTNLHFVEQYRRVGSTTKFGECIVKNLRLESIMSVLHERYHRPIAESAIYYDGNSQLNHLSASSTITSGIKLSTSDGALRDEVHGVIADDSQYLVVGDHLNGAFLKNNNLLVEKDKTIEQVIETTKFNAHTSYLTGTGLLTLSVLLACVECYFYFG